MYLNEYEISLKNIKKTYLFFYTHAILKHFKANKSQYCLTQF